MGCFSFVCKECGESIQSNGTTGDHCELFLLNDGEVVQHMSGLYNAYGRVFTSTKNDSYEEWKMSWKEVCNLMFNGDLGYGIAAYHTKCYSKDITPRIQSDDDPHQGWGDMNRPRDFYGKFDI